MGVLFPCCRRHAGSLVSPAGTLTPVGDSLAGSSFCGSEMGGMTPLASSPSGEGGFITLDGGFLGPRPALVHDHIRCDAAPPAPPRTCMLRTSGHLPGVAAYPAPPPRAPFISALFTPKDCSSPGLVHHPFHSTIQFGRLSCSAPPAPPAPPISTRCTVVHCPRCIIDILTCTFIWILTLLL